MIREQLFFYHNGRLHIFAHSPVAARHYVPVSRHREFTNNARRKPRFLGFVSIPANSGLNDVLRTSQLRTVNLSHEPLTHSLTRSPLSNGEGSRPQCGMQNKAAAPPPLVIVILEYNVTDQHRVPYSPCDTTLFWSKT